MDNIDRLYEISRLLANAERVDGGIFLSDLNVATINDNLARIYDALMEGDVDGEGTVHAVHVVHTV